MIDKNVDALTRFADRHMVMEKGRIVWRGDTDDLLNTPEVKEKYLYV